MAIPSLSEYNLPRDIIRSLPNHTAFKRSTFSHLWDWVRANLYFEDMLARFRFTLTQDFAALTRVRQQEHRDVVVGMFGRFLSTLTYLEDYHHEADRLEILAHIDALVTDMLHARARQASRVLNLESFWRGSLRTFNMIAGDCIRHGFLFEFMQCYVAAVNVFNDFIYLMNGLPRGRGAISAQNKSIQFYILAEAHSPSSGQATWHGRTLQFQDVAISIERLRGLHPDLFDHTTYGEQLWQVLLGYNRQFYPRGILGDASGAAMAYERDLTSKIMKFTNDRRQVAGAADDGSRPAHWLAAIPDADLDPALLEAFMDESEDIVAGFVPFIESLEQQAAAAAHITSPSHSPPSHRSALFPESPEASRGLLLEHARSDEAHVFYDDPEERALSPLRDEDSSEESD